mgnify:CR=1 FL=1
MKKIIIAIDGPAGSGKSTAAKHVANFIVPTQHMANDKYA